MPTATLSLARLEANRRNAQKSTGPKTDEGKANSRLNALKHGLTAESSSLLPPESEATYHTFTAEVFSDLNPKTPVQYLLVERESTSRRNEAPPAAPDPDPVEDHSAPHTLAHFFRYCDHASNPSLTLHRYECSLERSLNRCLKELRQFQKEYKTNPSTYEDDPIPPAPDVEGEEPPQEQPSEQNEATQHPSHASPLLPLSTRPVQNVPIISPR